MGATCAAQPLFGSRSRHTLRLALLCFSLLCFTCLYQSQTAVRQRGVAVGQLPSADAVDDYDSRDALCRSATVRVRDVNLTIGQRTVASRDVRHLFDNVLDALSNVTQRTSTFVGVLFYNVSMRAGDQCRSNRCLSMALESSSDHFVHISLTLHYTADSDADHSDASSGLLLHFLDNLQRFRNWVCSPTHSLGHLCLHRQLSVRLLLSATEMRPHYWLLHDGHSAARAFLPGRHSCLQLRGCKQRLAAVVAESSEFIAWQLSVTRQFLPCNQTRKQLFQSTYQEDDAPRFFWGRTIPLTSMQDLILLRDTFYRYQKTPILFDGTLLGWYRQCDIIPYTDDFDLSLPIGQYEPELFQRLFASRAAGVLGLKMRQGGRQHGFLFIKLLSYQSGVSLDLTFRLLLNESHEVAGANLVHTRQKLRYYYPRIAHYCTADLLGHLFMVPCNAEQLLLAEYGPGWFAPRKGLAWQQYHQNMRVVGRWSADEWRDEFEYHSHYSRQAIVLLAIMALALCLSAALLLRRAQLQRRRHL